MHLDAGLVVRCRGEGLALGGWNRGVTRDKGSGNAAERLYAQAERRDIQEEDVLHLALKHARLYRRAYRHHFVGVDALVRLLAEQIGYDFLHGRHPRHAANENYFVNLVHIHASVSDRLLARFNGSLHEFCDQLLQLGPGQAHDKVLRPRCVCRNER